MANAMQDDDFVDALDQAAEIAAAGLERPFALVQRSVRNTNKRIVDATSAERLRVEQADKEKRRVNEQRRTSLYGQKLLAEDRERRARREQTQGRFDAAQDYRERQAAYRRQRDAENQAYRAQRDAERDARRAPGAAGMQFSRPGTGVVPSGGGWEPDRAAVAKFIVFATAFGALGAVARDITTGAPPLQIGGTKVPAHLQSLGGAFIAGTIALIVNEVYPPGAVLGAGIVGLIVIPNWTPLIKGLGNLFQGGNQGFPKGARAARLPDGSTLITGNGNPYRLVPVGGGNYSTEPYDPNAAYAPGPTGHGTTVT